MNKIAFALAAISVAANINTAAAQDEYPEVTAGQWETTTSVTMAPFLPQPQVSTESSCIKEDETKFDPKELLADGDCTVSNLSTTSTKVSFSMVCNIEGTQVSGDGSFEVQDGGNAMNGTMNLTGTVAELNLNLDMLIGVTAKRTGACSS
ncbi:MAG: DUF3617 family protein [Pseudomonadota bacterium]